MGGRAVADGATSHSLTVFAASLLKFGITQTPTHPRSPLTHSNTDGDEHIWKIYTMAFSAGGWGLMGGGGVKFAFLRQLHPAHERN